MAGWVTNGSRVVVQFFKVQDNPPASLAGAMLKFGATQIRFTGTLRHVRGDAPTEAECKHIGIWVQPDGEVPVGIDPMGSDPWAVGHARCEECGCIEVGPLKPEWVGELLEKSEGT